MDNQERISYSFHDRGIMPLERTGLVPGNTPDIVSEPLHIPASAFDPEPLDDTPVFKTERHGGREGHLVTQSLYRNTGRVALHALAWGGTTENTVTAHEAARIFQALPQHNIMSITMPGHGEISPSKRWPGSVRAELLTTGSFNRAGRYLANALDGSLIQPGIESVDVFGFSTGGRSALSMAGHLRGPIDNLVLFDPPGTKTYSNDAFKRRYQVIEKAHGDAYTAASRDVQHKEVMSKVPSRGSMQYMKEFAKRDVLAALDFAWTERAALARGTLAADLEKVDLNNVGRVVVIAPAKSELNDPRDMYSVLRTASEIHHSTKFELLTFPGTHTITRMSSTVLAELSAQAIKSDGDKPPIPARS